MIQKLLRTLKLITSTITSSKARMIRKQIFFQIMQVTNGNKRSATFPTSTNVKNISLITEIKFLTTLMNTFASIKIRNLKGVKNDIFAQ